MIELTLLAKENGRHLFQFDGVAKLLGHVFNKLEVNVTDNCTTVRPVTPDGVVQPEVVIIAQSLEVALLGITILITNLPDRPTQVSWWLPEAELGHDNDTTFYTYSPSPGILMTMTIPYKPMQQYPIKEEPATTEEYYLALTFCESEFPFYQRPYSSN